MNIVEILEEYFAGEWKNDPDGGVCSACKAAYTLGVLDAADEALGHRPSDLTLVRKIHKLLEKKEETNV